MMTSKHAQRGLSIVELLVGVAIGLIITATGAALMASHLRESRALLIEARLMQDLRTASDLITRDLRRAGYWGSAVSGLRLRGGSAPSANPYAALAPSESTSNAVTFRYSRDGTENNALDGNEQFGYRLKDGAIQLQLGAGNWQALTDANTLTVTTFSVTPVFENADLADACAIACAGPTCPRQQVRRLDVSITGRATGDAGVSRQIRGSVRLRNDMLTGACPA